MNTKFTFYDKDNKLNNAELILSLEINNKKYIIYELEEEKISEYDIMHIGEYEEIDNIPHIYNVSNDEIEIIKKQISEITKII